MLEILLWNVENFPVVQAGKARMLRNEMLKSFEVILLKVWGSFNLALGYFLGCSEAFLVVCFNKVFLNKESPKWHPKQVGGGGGA